VDTAVTSTVVVTCVQANSLCRMYAGLNTATVLQYSSLRGNLSIAKKTICTADNSACLGSTASAKRMANHGQLVPARRSRGWFVGGGQVTESVPIPGNA